MDKRREVGGLVRRWRLATDPLDVPGYGDLPVRSGRQGHLTQEDMALLVGASDRWYRALEQGTAERIGPHILEGVVDVLGLNDLQRDALYAAYGRQAPPPRPPGPLPSDDPLRLLVQAQRHPAYVSDSGWDIVEANEHAKRQYPWVRRPGANIMVWCLSEAAREQLPAWYEEWARPMVAQLRMAAVQDPDHPRLQEVAQTVRAYEPIDRLWRDDSLALTHPYGSVRSMRPLTEQGRLGEPESIRLVALAPLTDPRMRLMILMRLPDAGCDGPPQ